MMKKLLFVMGLYSGITSYGMDQERLILLGIVLNHLVPHNQANNLQAEPHHPRESRRLQKYQMLKRNQPQCQRRHFQ